MNPTERSAKLQRMEHWKFAKIEQGPVQELACGLTVLKNECECERCMTRMILDNQFKVV